MDKGRNLRRGISVFSSPNKPPHMMNKHKRLFGVSTASSNRGELKFWEKSKKEKVRSLSAMCCHVSEKEEAEAEAEAASPSSSASLTATKKRLQVPKNLLNDSNGVHHASVPRKLRSAMKKRSRESMLLDSEKVNHKINGIIESPKRDGIKKSKVRVKQEITRERPQGESVSVAITKDEKEVTKDEEEVAATLYAMAKMFPDHGMNDSNELCGESLPENSSVLEDSKESANATFEASETAQQASPCPETSPREATKTSSSSHETIGQEQLGDLPEREELLMASHSTTATTIDLQTMPMKVKSENSNKDAALHHDPDELCLAMGLKMSKQSQISHIKRKLDAELETAKYVDCKQEQNMLKDQKENEGLTLWPDLSPVASYEQSSSATEVPGWLEAAICASKQDLMGGCSSSGKTSQVVTHKRSWKRCAAHVHISHIIHSLEAPKRRVVDEPELHECHRMRAQEGSNHGVLLEQHNLIGMRNGVTLSSAPETSQYATLRNQNESKNGIIVQQQCHYSGLSQANPKQSFNFLSLSAGSNGSKLDNTYYDKIGTRLEALSKLQVPYFQSLPPQHHGIMSIPTPQKSQYAPTSSYLDHLSVSGPQVRLQQPQYYGNPLCGTHYSSTVSSKQHHHQSLLAVQLAAQSRSAINCNMMRTPQYPNWQSGRHNEYTMNPSLEALGSKITSSISVQQQQLIASIQEKWARSSSPFCM